MKRQILMKWGLLFLVVMLVLTSCRKNYEVPAEASPLSEKLSLYPDYTSIVIPPNIAPLNFIVRGEGTGFVVCMHGKASDLVAGAGRDGKVAFDADEWKRFLSENKGRNVEVTVYVERDGRWFAYPKYPLCVAPEPIDRYVSYRLIEPGFEIYRQIGLYQRDVTTFDVQTIYENNRKYKTKVNHCVNCHNYQNYSTKRMLFHVRSNMGGTLIAENGKITKMNMKSDSVLSSAVYPTWHPRRNWIVFSSNQTGQTFHLLNTEKIEVVDFGSDLIFYNADTREISNIIKSDDALETFPCWNPEGNRIYYCEAATPFLAGQPDSVRSVLVVQHYRDLKYNIKSIAFDEKTQTFGEPRMEVECSRQGKSASVPRISPDGRYLLFTLGDYGQFHIWHHSADLYVKDLKTGSVYPLSAANSRNTDSYHSWSSNGRWITFSSRRDDGSYTRLYMAYFDRDGKAHKAFILPQRDPTQNISLLKSYNVPEMTRDAVPFSKEDFREAIYHQEGTPVSYKEIRPGRR